MQKLPLLLTTGEPAGIGMDVVLLLANEGKLQGFDRPIWVTANSQAMQARADALLAAGVLATCPSWQMSPLKMSLLSINSHNCILMLVKTLS